jgi:hypothetical protein
MGELADVSELLAAAIFRVEACSLPVTNIHSIPPLPFGGGMDWMYPSQDMDP